MTMSQSDRTVLIVNDSLLERTTYRCYLQEETSFAYTIWEAESTEEGLRLCSRKIPDSIVLDYLLPDRDGLEFLVELTTRIGENCPPVIMLNDPGNEAIAIRALKAGVEDYLIKSEITPECLRCVTRTAIENFRLRQKLRESEERYRAIVEDQTELICRFSLDYTLTFVNSAYSRYFSSTPNRLIGQNFLNLIPESYQSTVQQQIAELVKLSDRDARATGAATPENAVMTHEHPVLKPNGDLGWQQWTNRAIFDDNGQLIEFQAVGRDISDRKLVEQRWQESEERLQLGVQVAGVALAKFDYASNTVELSKEAAALYGLPTDELTVTRDRIHATFHPEEREIMERIIQQVLDPTGDGWFEREHRLIWHNGEVRWLYVRKRVFFDQSGDFPRPSYAILAAIDITERKQAEAALQESERKFSAVFAQTFELMGLVSVDGILLDINQAALDSIDAQSSDLIGKRFWETPWWHSVQLQNQLREAIAQAASGQTIRYQVQFFNAKGGITTTDFSLKPVVSESGEVMMLIAEGRDITERIQAEQERDRLLAEAQAARAAAEEANRSKDEFVAVVAHELRSPINSVAGWAQLLRMEKIDAATTDRALEAIARGTQTQVQLIEDLLDICRMACGTLRLTIAPVNLVTVMEAALSLMRPMVDAKQIHLETRFVAIAQVSGDRNRLQQIVVNLLTNAIKFTPEGGQITMTLEQVGKQARIQVSDTGKGISTEFLPNIFERFQQAQKNAGSKDGLGLGLAIVKNLVEMHNGKITAESPGVGQGATFTVWLPLLEREQGTLNREPGIDGIEIQTSPLTGIRILAVDDEPDSLELLRFILEEAGAEVRTASSGSVALDILPQFNPSLIVSDIAMPDLNGYELLQQIRMLYPDRQIPAIALTAYTSSSDREYSMRIGFEKYFSKPIEPEALVQYIISSIGKRFDLLT